MLNCHKGDAQAVARARLQNVGYLHGEALEGAMAAFRLDHDLDDDPAASSGNIPEDILPVAASLWSARHD
jgi:hypothetical protein